MSFQKEFFLIRSLFVNFFPLFPLVAINQKGQILLQESKNVGIKILIPLRNVCRFFFSGEFEVIALSQLFTIKINFKPFLFANINH